MGGCQLSECLIAVFGENRSMQIWQYHCYYFEESFQCHPSETWFDIRSLACAY